MATFPMPPDYGVTYLILAHKNPRQVARLVERLGHRQARFWVHLDRKANAVAFGRELVPRGVRFVAERYDVRWGAFSLVEAKLAGFRAIESAGEPYDHLVVLSGQDYPLVSTPALLGYLSAHRTDSFVHHGALGPDNNPHLLSRLAKYHLPLPRNRALVYPYDSGGILKQSLNTLLRLSGRYPYPRPLPLPWPQWYFGSNWVRLRPEAVGYLLRLTDHHPAINRYFRQTYVADEHYFQTLLLNASEAERGTIQNTNLTYSHWHRPDACYHQPLGWDDYDALLASGCLFARKFDAEADHRILNRLDARFA